MCYTFKNNNKKSALFNIYTYFSQKKKKKYIYIYIFTRTLFGAGSRAILALTIIPNWPKPPRTA